MLLFFVFSENLFAKNHLLTIFNSLLMICHCLALISILLINLTWVVDFGVYPSLHPNCRHQIFYCKFNFMVEHLLQYELLVSNCKWSNQNAISKALD